MNSSDFNSTTFNSPDIHSDTITSESLHSESLKVQSLIAAKSGDGSPEKDSSPDMPAFEHHASQTPLALVDLAAHKTMEEALPFTVEWEGNAYRVFVPRSVLEDLDQAPSYRQDAQLVAAFKRNEAIILKRTLGVLEKGRGRWGTVLLKQYDFPELYQ